MQNHVSVMVQEMDGSLLVSPQDPQTSSSKTWQRFHRPAEHVMHERIATLHWIHIYKKFIKNYSKKTRKRKALGEKVIMKMENIRTS